MFCQLAKTFVPAARSAAKIQRSGIFTAPSRIHKLGDKTCNCGFCSAGKGDSRDELVELATENKRLVEEIRYLKGKYGTLQDLPLDTIMKEDSDIAKLLQNNREWVKAQSASNPNFFKKIGGKQEPKYLYIGCADSRVPANEILGLGPGEVFVHRNVGNLVIGSDLNVLSCIEFAVEFLGVQHIIVTGHYDCGAVINSAKTQDLGLLENWLRSIRDVYRTHQRELVMISDDEARLRRLVELNVIEQCLNVYKTGVVQRKRKESSVNGKIAYPRVHAMVFDPKIGILHKLPVNFKQTINQFKDIYNLY